MNRLLVLATLLTSLMSMPVFAGDGMGFKGKDKGPRFGKGGLSFGLFKQLDLTPEQKEKIKTIKQETRTSMKDAKAAMKAEHETMHSLLSSADATNDAIRTQHKKVQELMSKAQDARIETMLKIREVLSPDQRAKLAKLMAERGGRGPGRFRQGPPEENEDDDLDL